MIVKELAAYCNQLCEEEHGNADVMLNLGEGITKADAEDILYDEDKLVITMSDNIENLLSDTPSSVIYDILCRRDDSAEFEHEAAREYIENMDSDEKALLVKQWIQDIL